jgi:hypothetical protein
MAPGDDYRFKHRVFVGTNRTSVWIGGKVYTLMYDRTEPQGVQEARVKPAQGRLVRWSDVWNVVCIRVDGRTRKPSLIRVLLTHVYRLPRFGPGLAGVWLTGVFYLRPTTRNEKLRPILAKMKMEQRSIPFLMGTHGRLGDQSLVGGLDADLVHSVCHLA